MADMHEKIKQAILDGSVRAAELNVDRKANGWVVAADPLVCAAGSVEALIKAEFKQSPDAFARWIAS